MLLEKYGPTFIHIKGGKNVVANALFRFDMEAYSKDTISQKESYKFSATLELKIWNLKNFLCYLK